MQDQFFYTPAGLISQTIIRIEGDEMRHLVQVMRHRAGDSIVVVDGTGNAYDAVIAKIAARCVECENHGRHLLAATHGLPITAAVGILKNPSRFDMLVEKLTELGVHTIVPLVTSHTIARHDKTERWEKVAIAAMKQSGRASFPHIAPLTEFQKFVLRVSPTCLALIPHEETTTPVIPDLLRNHGRQSITVCIGPEGGFTPEEISFAAAKGFYPVSLGPHRLRSETAAIVASAMCILLGDAPLV